MVEHTASFVALRTFTNPDNILRSTLGLKTQNNEEIGWGNPGRPDKVRQDARDLAQEFDILLIDINADLLEQILNAKAAEAEYDLPQTSTDAAA